MSWLTHGRILRTTQRGAMFASALLNDVSEKEILLEVGCARMAYLRKYHRRKR